MRRQVLIWALLEGLALVAVAPFLLFPGGWRALALLGVPGWWLVRWWRRGHLVAPTPLDLPILLLLVQVLVSLWATADPAFSLPKVAGVVLGVAVYYAVAEVVSSGGAGLALAVAAFLAAGVGLAGVGALGLRTVERLPVLRGVLVHLPQAIRGLPGAEEGFNIHEVGGALLWVVPVALALWGWSLGGRRLRPLPRLGAAVGLTLALASTLGVLVLTQSRGSWAGFAVGLWAMLLVQGWSGFLLSLLIVAVGGGAVAYLGLDAVREWVVRAAGPAIVPMGLGGRVEIWSRALYAIGDFPFTGMGMNMFRRVAPVLYPLFGSPQDRDIAHAHNEFLQAALDLGAPGLVAFLALYLGAGWVLLRTVRQERGFRRALAVGVLGGLVAHGAFGCVDAVALGAKPGFLFWWLLALAGGVEGDHREHREI
ncbi:MAG: O-antigen ligase family protein [Anaerolineae bacterium]|nr:O-antigen ligase family protein [Anaerolineae bacterium]